MPQFKLLAGCILTALVLLPATSPAQTVTIVSGNGQLVCPDCTGAFQGYAPLVVQVNDASGNPVANTTVTWTATQSGYSPVTSTTTTNSSGQATYKFVPLAFFFGSNFLPATIVASALNTSASFVETTATPTSSGAAPAFAALVPASATPALTGTAGQTLGTPITVSVTGFISALPNVQISLQPWVNGKPAALPWPAGKPSVTCATQPGQQPGTVLTNSAGLATCTPVFGNTLGTGTYALVVGGNFVNFGSTAFTVNPGAPALITITAGNNQTVNQGKQATSALQAKVTDMSGNALSKVPVKWTVTQGAATFGNFDSSSESTGLVQAYVTPTSGPTVQVTVALANNSAVKAVFTINVTSVVTGLQYVSGNNQTAKMDTAFAEPLIVQVNDNNQTVPNASVSFTVNSGDATLSSPTAVSGVNGQASVTVTAGDTAGPVVITASITSSGNTYTQVFNLIVNTGSAIISSVTNAASFQSQFVSPCGLATIFGTGLATGIEGVASSFLGPQTQVAGVTVSFNNVLAPILDVANVNGQESVSIQVPCEVPSSSAKPPATVPMIVTVNGTASPAFNVTVLPVSPGIFQFTDTDGKVRAVLVRPDGSYASISNPARRGETIRLFATGLGQTTPALFTNENDPLTTDSSGDLIPEELSVNAGVIVGVNNGGVNVLAAHYAYFGVGVYEVDFEVPSNTPTGNNAPFALVLTEGTNVVFGNGSLIAIQ